MTRPLFKLNKTIAYRDHKGRDVMATEASLWHWNHVRFQSLNGLQEIARSKVNLAGARMVPVNSEGNPLDLSASGPDIEIEQIQQRERKAVHSV